MLATNLATNRVEERRKSSFDALRGIERWVLEHGFLELVALRNRFARALGYDNYFDIEAAEERAHDDRRADAHPRRLRPADRRRERARAGRPAQRSTATTRPRRGTSASFASGDVVRRLDPYMPFGLALRRWIHSFRRLGIQFRGATMQLDLLERPGKHQNGFCHGPVPSWITEDGPLGAGRDQLHGRGEARSGRQRPPRDQHALSRGRPRRALRQRRAELAVLLAGISRRRRWPTRRRSRCSATACCRTPTG